MTETQLLGRIKALVAEVCEIDADDVHDDGRLLGYGIDSVRALDLFTALEDEWGLAIDEGDPELRQVHTVRDLAAFAARRAARQG